MRDLGGPQRDISSKTKVGFWRYLAKTRPENAIAIVLIIKHIRARNGEKKKSSVRNANIRHIQTQLKARRNQMNPRSKRNSKI